VFGWWWAEETVKLFGDEFGLGVVGALLFVAFVLLGFFTFFVAFFVFLIFSLLFEKRCQCTSGVVFVALYEVLEGFALEDFPAGFGCIGEVLG
jgi:hypothetical protein